MLHFIAWVLHEKHFVTKFVLLAMTDSVSGGEHPFFDSIPYCFFNHASLPGNSIHGLAWVLRELNDDIHKEVIEKTRYLPIGTVITEDITSVRVLLLLAPLSSFMAFLWL